MASIGFIGIGNMGAPMAQNLVKSGHKVEVFDLNQAVIATLVEQGCTASATLFDLAKNKDLIVTMLPAGQHVEDVYLKTLNNRIDPTCLVLDCSTIYVATARKVASALNEKACQWSMHLYPAGLQVQRRAP